MRPKLRMPKAKSRKPRIRRGLPDKVGKVKHIYDLRGSLLMTGTEREWRSWVKARR